MKRTLIMAAAAAFMFSGCGEDSATEPRVNLITMINATDADIVGHLFNNSFYTIAPKGSHDDDFESIDEAPSVWYTTVIDTEVKIGEETIHSGDIINAYIAADCVDGNSQLKNHILHHPSAGSINIVNTTSDTFAFDVGGTEETLPACGVREFDGASLSGEDNVTVTYGGQTVTVPLPKAGEVFDVVIFPDYTFERYDVKAFKG